MNNSLSRGNLIHIEKDGPRTFPKGVFISDLFGWRINQKIAKIISNNSAVRKMTVKEIQDSGEIFSLPKQIFLSKVLKTLEQLS